MARRRHRPDASADDVPGLEAVWGREASGRAEPVPAPTMVPFDQPAPPGGGGRRSWWPLVGAVVALAFVAAGVVVVVSGGDDEVADTGRASTTIDGGSDTTATTEVPPWAPRWTVPLACPRFEVDAETRTTECPITADDERIYVLEQRDDVATIVSRAAPSGAEGWTLAVPGAQAIQRFPSTLVVWAESTVTAVDPVSGRATWTAPGEGAMPAGRDHLIVDDLTEDDQGVVSVSSVRAAATGEVVSELSGPASETFRFACADDGLVLDSVGTTLSAAPVEGGGQVWSDEAPHHHLGDPVLCSGGFAAAVEDDQLVVRRSSLGMDVGTIPVGPPAGGATLLGLVGSTVVVGDAAGLRGFVVPEVDQVWELVRDGFPDGVRVGPSPAGDGVGIAIPGDIAAWYGADGTPGPQLGLDGLDEVVVDAGRVVAWGDGDLLAAPLIDLDRWRRTDDEEVEDVRAAAVGATYVAVTTRDQLVVYPYDP